MGRPEVLPPRWQPGAVSLRSLRTQPGLALLPTRPAVSVEAPRTSTESTSALIMSRNQFYNIKTRCLSEDAIGRYQRRLPNFPDAHSLSLTRPLPPSLPRLPPTSAASFLLSQEVKLSGQDVTSLDVLKLKFLQKEFYPCSFLQILAMFSNCFSGVYFARN